MDSEREIRCIVLFTRSPEEASYVGDRVVILEHGRIHAKGTPSFIKSVFGNTLLPHQFVPMEILIRIFYTQMEDTI